jgi:hypothetical protein
MAGARHQLLCGCRGGWTEWRHAKRPVEHVYVFRIDYVQLHGVAEFAGGRSSSYVANRDRDDDQWLRLECDEQRELDYGDRRQQRHGQWNGQLLCRREHRHDIAHRYADGSGANRDGYSKWRAVHVYALAHIAKRRGRRRITDDGRHDDERLCVERDEQRELDHDHRGR